MVVSAVVVGGAAVAGSAIASKGAKDAAKTQANAAKDAANTSALANQEAADIQTKAIEKAKQEQLYGAGTVRNVNADTITKMGDSTKNTINEAAGILTGATNNAADAAIKGRTDATSQYQAGIDAANAAYMAAVAQSKAGVTDARDKSNLLLKDIYDKNVALYDPYVKGGQQASQQMADGLKAGGDFNRAFTEADFQKDGGYNFRLNEGLNTVQNSALARGGLLSGDALKAVTDYGQGFASNEYDKAATRWSSNLNDRFGRLATVANQGLTANGAVGNLGQVYGKDVSGNNFTAASQLSDLNLKGADWTGKNTISGALYGANNTMASGDIRANAIGTVGNIQAGAVNDIGNANLAYLNSTGQNLVDYANKEAAINSGSTLAIGNAQAAGKTGAADAIATGIQQAGNATSAGQAGSANAWANGLNSIANTYTTFYTLGKKKPDGTTT